MKGGGWQLRQDVRRRWRCECGREAKTAGDVTAVPCGCGRWMSLQDLPPAGFPPENPRPKHA